MALFDSNRFSRTKRIAKCPEFACILLAVRPRIGVDRRTKCNVHKPNPFDHDGPSRTGQGAGNSTGPEADVPFGVLRKSIVDTYIGHLYPTPRAEHPRNFPISGHLVGHEVEHPV